MKKLAKIFGIITLVAIIGFSMAACESNDEDESSGGGGGSSGGGSGNNLLAAPTGVTAEGISSSSIEISWNAVTGAGGYFIYRANSSSGPWAEIGSAWSSPYTSSNLAANTTFYFKVESADSYWSWATRGRQSSAVSATTFLVAPTGVSATSTTSSSITINWNNLTGATGYRIYRSESWNGSFTEIGTSTTNSYTNTGLPSNVEYYYRVSGFNSSTGGDNSSSVSARTLLQAPTGVTATANSSSSITITWNAATDAGGYAIFRSTSLSGTYVEIGRTSSLTYTNTGLSPGTTFYYKVASADGSWSWSTLGEQSSAVYATTF